MRSTRSSIWSVAASSSRWSVSSSSNRDDIRLLLPRFRWYTEKRVSGPRPKPSESDLARLEGTRSPGGRVLRVRRRSPAGSEYLPTGSVTKALLRRHPRVLLRGIHGAGVAWPTACPPARKWVGRNAVRSPYLTLATLAPCANTFVAYLGPILGVCCSLLPRSTATGYCRGLLLRVTSSSPRSASAHPQGNPWW
jgi:hypothetical protein